MYSFYVYAYIRQDGSPYYIGKGKGNRAFNKKHSAPLPKDKSRVVFLEMNLSEIGALALERRYIKWFGRKDLGTGILLNMTDGGDGVSGRVFCHTPTSREAISNSLKGKPAAGNFKGKKHSEESKEKISKKSRGRKHTEESIKKMKRSQSNRKPISDETREKLKGRDQSGKNNPMFGRKHSPETKEKMRLARLKRSQINFPET